MTEKKIYYLLDNVSETILGSFLANSDRMAKKVLSAFDFQKANLSVDEVSVYCGPDVLFYCDTYSEVIDCDNGCVQVHGMFDLG